MKKIFRFLKNILFPNDYNLGAYLEEWKQEQQEQIPNIPEPEIPTPTSLDYMDIGR